MNLPPLPEPSPYVPVYRPLWAEDRMREYGALCYRQALKEAIEAYESPICGNRGFAGPTCCILPKGHAGNHSYGTPPGNRGIEAIKELMK